MIRFMKTATALSTATLLGLGVATAQETDTDMQDDAVVEAEVQAEAETEASASQAEELTTDEFTELAENQFTAADANTDEQLDMQEYEAFSSAIVSTMKDDYLVSLDTEAEIRGAGLSVDVTSSQAIAERLNRDNSDYYENAVGEDKMQQAVETRFAELSGDSEAITSATLLADGETKFRAADADENELLEGDELNVFASSFTGLQVSEPTDEPMDDMMMEEEAESMDDAQG